MKGEVALATAIVFFFHYRIWAVLLIHFSFSFFSSLSFRLSNEIHLSYTVAAWGYRILGVFAIDHSLHHTRVSFCFGGGFRVFWCVFFFSLGLFWGFFGGWVCSFGLFVYLSGGGWFFGRLIGGFLSVCLAFSILLLLQHFEPSCFLGMTWSHLTDGVWFTVTCSALPWHTKAAWLNLRGPQFPQKSSCLFSNEKPPATTVITEDFRALLSIAALYLWPACPNPALSTGLLSCSES